MGADGVPIQTVSAPPAMAEGVGLGVKFVAEVAVPPGVVTVILPPVAPLGTVAVIWVSELMIKPTETPLKETLEAVLK